MAESAAVIRNKWIISILCIIAYIISSMLKMSYFDYSTRIIFLLNVINIASLIFYINALIFLIRYADNILTPDVATTTANKLLKAFYFGINGVMSVYMMFFITRFVYTCHTDNCVRISNIGNAFTVLYNMFTVAMMSWLLVQLMFFTFLPSCVWLLPTELADHKIEPIKLYDTHVIIYVFIIGAFVLFLDVAMLFSRKLEYTELLTYGLIFRLSYASYLMRSSIESEIKTFRSAILWGMTLILMLTSYIVDTTILIINCKHKCYHDVNGLMLASHVNQHMLTVVMFSGIVYGSYILCTTDKTKRDPMYQPLLSNDI